jgi:hypothetical protein
LSIGLKASKLPANNTPDLLCRAWQSAVDESVGLGPNHTE